MTPLLWRDSPAKRLQAAYRLRTWHFLSILGGGANTPRVCGAWYMMALIHP
jgi:hypothetical protein